MSYTCKHGVDPSLCFMCRQAERVKELTREECCLHHSPNCGSPDFCCPGCSMLPTAVVAHPSTCYHIENVAVDDETGRFLCNLCGFEAFTAAQLFASWIKRNVALVRPDLAEQMETLPARWQEEATRWRDRAQQVAKVLETVQTVNETLVDATLRICDAAGMARTAPLATGSWDFDAIVRHIAKLRDQAYGKTETVPRVDSMASESDQRGGDDA